MSSCSEGVRTVSHEPGAIHQEEGKVKCIRQSERRPRVGYALRRYIPQNMEAVLAEYALTVSRLYYGMTPHDLNKLAFQFCVANNIDVPEVWRRNEISGPDWMAGFLKRNANLSIRTPEATSLARASLLIDIRWQSSSQT